MKKFEEQVKKAQSKKAPEGAKQNVGGCKTTGCGQRRVQEATPARLCHCGKKLYPFSR
jgi:hypothetical protein